MSQKQNDICSVVAAKNETVKKVEEVKEKQ